MLNVGSYTPNEVREIKYDLQTQSSEYVLAKAVIEVAAQLAELNQHLQKGVITVDTMSHWAGGPKDE